MSLRAWAARLAGNTHVHPHLVEFAWRVATERSLLTTTLPASFLFSPNC